MENPGAMAGLDSLDALALESLCLGQGLRFRAWGLGFRV